MGQSKKHNLFEPHSDKIFSISLLGNKVIIEKGKMGKTKITEKEFSDNEEAVKHFEKKEWEILKKGFVFKNEKTKTGEPKLHYFVGTGYTGSLSFESTQKGIYIYKHGLFKSEEDQKDFLILIDENGYLKETIELPRVLAWDIQFNKYTNSLLLDLDHYIFEFNLDNNSFNQLLDRGNGKWASFISCENDKIAYGTNHNFKITDGKNILQKNYEVEIIKGSIPFCAALSKNGKILALHNHIGEVQLINTVDGKILKTITGDFQMIGQLEFIENDNVLVSKENYRTWKMHYFDLQTLAEIKYESLELPEYSKDVNYFAFNAAQTKLALIQKTKAYIFDFTTKKFSHSFKIEHTVKTAKPKFIGDYLGFRTDYGCFSLYKT